MKLLVKLLSENATVPVRGTPGSAGYDIFSSADTVLPAKGQGFVETDISVAIPLGAYGRIAPRSGLAAKHGIDTGAGVIDSDYRGPIKVILFNHSNVDYQIKKGDRVAQLILEVILTADIDVVEILDDTKRGAGGFGSTGYSATQPKP